MDKLINCHVFLNQFDVILNIHSFTSSFFNHNNAIAKGNVVTHNVATCSSRDEQVWIEVIPHVSEPCVIIYKIASICVIQVVISNRFKPHSDRYVFCRKN